MKSDNKGISLVELLVSLLIGSFLMMGLYVTLLVGQNSFLFADDQGQMQQSLTQGISKLSWDLGHAVSIEITDATEGAGGDIKNKDILKFKRVSWCQDDNDDCYVKYYLNEDQLMRQIRSSLDVYKRENVVATNIQDFDIDQFDVVDNKISLQLTSEKWVRNNVNNDSSQDTMGQTMAFRNEIITAFRNGVQLK